VGRCGEAAHTPALTATFWRLLFATPLMAAIALIGGARWPRRPELGWLTLGLSIGAILLFFWLLRRQKGGEATSFLYVVPSLTAIAAVPVLGQSLSAGVVVGLVLGLIGVNLVGGGRAQRSPGLRSRHVQKHQNSLQLRSTGQ
jgi:drug/metabolite transporter (DMT)-like permease